MFFASSIPLPIVQEDQDIGGSLKTSAWNPGFNYTMIEDFPYSWIEINETGTEFIFSVDDDDGHNYTSFADNGWSFTFYGTEYDWLNVSTNGWMMFTNPDINWTYDWSSSDSWTPSEIPQNHTEANREKHNDTAFLFHTDLYPGSGGEVYYQFFGTAPNRYLVIEYYQVAEVDYYDPQTMEAIFYENGDIHFQYKSIIINSTWSYPNAVVGLDHGDLINYNVYTNNWSQTFNNQSVFEKSVYFRLSELPPGTPPIPGADIALISLSSLIAIVVIVRKFKKSKKSKF
jgi:hypothetical protein